MNLIPLKLAYVPVLVHPLLDMGVVAARVLGVVEFNINHGMIERLYRIKENTQSTFFVPVNRHATCSRDMTEVLRW